MESRLARQLEEDLVAAERRLSPAERLVAFLAHSRLMAELHAAGQRGAGPAPPAKAASA